MTLSLLISGSGRGTWWCDPLFLDSRTPMEVRPMIKGVHTMFYSSKPEELRAFLRDKLGFPYTDVGEGWLIFDLPEADMGCHPAETDEGKVPSGTQSISFYCDDIKKTVAELKARGVEFVDAITDAGFGLITHFKMPGDFKVMLYQPRYSKHA
jgi:catechol 2,3-dioxygenase-like lactoylglutathione lyase family enzyme